MVRGLRSETKGSRFESGCWLCAEVSSCQSVCEAGGVKEITSPSPHYVKNVQIRSFFWSVFSCIWTEYRKIRTRKNCVFGHSTHSACESWKKTQTEEEKINRARRHLALRHPYVIITTTEQKATGNSSVFWPIPYIFVWITLCFYFHNKKLGNLL